MMTKSELIEMLHNFDMTVKFQKKDGSERTMICTLADDVIPEEATPKGTGSKLPEDSDQIRVFDLEKEAWRSFNYSTVISAEREIYVPGT